MAALQDGRNGRVRTGRQPAWGDMAVVGRIARPHGRHGQVIVDAETDFPEERFRAGGELFVARAGQAAPLTLTAVRFQQGRPILAFAGVGRIEDAERLAGLEVRVPKEQLKRLPVGVFYRHDLAGCRVETRAGIEVGVVAGVEGNIQASRLVVASGGEEILIPLVSEICVEIDTNCKRIVIDPPEGLLELNRNHKGHKGHKVAG